MAEPRVSQPPQGLVVESVDWLPSGERSGLVRVRGRWSGDAPLRELPALVFEHEGEQRRHASLPDPRAAREPGSWRGAYVIDQNVFSAVRQRLELEFPNGSRLALPPPGGQPPRIEASPPSPVADDEAVGEVVDRAVLAERRARRAEAAEQAQARIAREALRAVEVLELRGSELEERLEKATHERDALARQLADGAAVEREGEEAAAERALLERRLAEAEAREAVLRRRIADLEERARATGEAERRAERLRSALTSSIATLAQLRMRIAEAGLERRTADVARTADAVRLAVVEAERAALTRQLAQAREALRGAREEIDRAREQATGADSAHAETRRRLAEKVSELGDARRQLGDLERDLADARRRAEKAVEEEVAAAVEAAVAERRAALAAEEAEARAAAAQREQAIAARESELAERSERLEAASTGRERDLDARRSALDVREREIETLRAQAADAREAWEETAAELHARLTRAEEALAEAATARQLAEAAATAAETEKRRAQVAHAALAEELLALRGERVALVRDLEAERAARSSLAQELEAARADLARREALAEASGGAEVAETTELAEREDPAELVRRAAEAAAAGRPGADDPARRRLVADLVAAAEALRRRTPQERESEPAPAPSGTRPSAPPRPLQEDTTRAREHVPAPPAPPAPEAAQLPATQAGTPRGAAEAAAAPPQPRLPLPQPGLPPTEPGLPPTEPGLPPTEPGLASTRPGTAGKQAEAALAATRPGAAPPEAPGASEATIVSAPSEPPSSIATGRAAREYPALRGALAKLAHDDPLAAGRLLAGLLPAQGRVVREPVDYDVTIRGLGTWAVQASPEGAIATRLEAPRRRRRADFHLAADPLTFAEMIAGVGPRPRRFGRARLSGSRRRRFRVLEAIPASGLSLEQAVAAGARLDPVLVLRCMAYAIHPTWTRGHDFAIEERILAAEGAHVVYVIARDGRGVEVGSEPPPDGVDATVSITAAAFDKLLRNEAVAPGERPSVRGDHRAVMQLRAWADRVRSGDPGGE